MSTRKRKHRPAQPAAAAAAAVAEPLPVAAAFTSPAPSFAYAIRCSRTSQLLDVDDECFVDCWKDEITVAEDAAIESATAYDGTWLWSGKLPNRPGSIRTGGGKPLLFPSADTAAETAGQAWVSLLQAVQKPCRPLLQQLQQQQQEGEEDSSSVGDELAERPAAAAAGGRKPSKRSTAAHGSAKQAGTGSRAEQRAATAAAPTIAAVAFKQVSTSGRASWQAWVKWFDDPFGMAAERPIDNIVRSRIKVEVVKVRVEREQVVHVLSA